MRRVFSIKFASVLPLLAALLCWCAAPAMAGVPPVTVPAPLITIDEDGHGSIDFSFIGGAIFQMQGALAPDPGPGGYSSVLSYNLLGPPSLVAGDVLLYDPEEKLFLDVIRFNPIATGSAPEYPASVLFYSDNLDGSDALGDTPGPPTEFYTNQVRLVEEGFEGFNGAYYTPTESQPGYVNGFHAQYKFISDATVPEPRALALLGAGLGIMALSRIRRS